VIKPTLPADSEVVTGEAFAKETRDAIKKGLGFINKFLLVFAFIALFVGGFIIFNTFSMLVGQRTRELALLRAVGASRAQVQRVVFGESLVVGLVGGIVGLLLGMALATGLKALFAAFGLDITGSLPVAPRTVVLSMVLALVVTTASAVIPAIRASRIPPMAALRDDFVPKVGSLRIRGGIGIGIAVAGVASVVAGLIPEDVKWPLLGLGAALVVLGTLVAAPLLTRPVVRVVSWPFVATRGTVGRLARENALRNPRRTATTASALMIGLALISAFTVVAASTKASVSDLVESQLKADFVVTGGQAAFGDGVGQALAATPSVASVAQIGSLQLDVEGDSLPSVAATSQGLDDNIDMTMLSGDLTALDSGQLLINQSTAEDKGWAVGDTVTATLGTLKDQQYTVGGIYEDNQVLGSGIVVPRSTYEKAVPSSLRYDYAVFVKAADGIDPESLRPAIVKTVKPYLILSVENGDEFVDSQAQQINQVLYLLYGLLALSVIIAFFGIVNTLALSVFERTREIGLLRAVGLTKRQLRRMIGIESVATSVFGAVLGCLVGLGLGIALQRGLVSDGLEVLKVPVVSLIVFVILAGVAGMIAAIFPAWRAVKLDMLKAISSE
jgi:putative ABC transport system permease protein